MTAPLPHSTRTWMPVGKGTFGALAARAQERGFVVLPVEGKKPALRGWNGRPLRAAAIDTLLARKPDLALANLGFRTGKLVAIDIDHTDKMLAWRISQKAKELLGDTPYVRVGQFPKRMLFYRLDCEVTSRTVGRVDILSAGKFAVVSGTHPTTRKSYYWPDECMLDAEFEDVPKITEAMLDKFVAAIARMQSVRAPTNNHTARIAVTPNLRKSLPPNNTQIIGQGERNHALFQHLKNAALSGHAEGHLRSIAHRFNTMKCHPPLPDREVERTLKSVLKYRSEGRLFAPGKQQIVLPLSMDVLKKMSPEATQLYAVLKATRTEPTFTIPQKGTAKALGWGDKRVKKAINSLLTNGLIKEVSRRRQVGKTNILYAFT